MNALAVANRKGRIAAATARLPAGTLHVGCGLGVFGLSSYVFLAIGARRLPPEQFAALSTLWVLVYTGGPGIFLPFEQAVGRALAMHRGNREHERSTLRVLVLASLAALAGLLIVVAALRAPITGRLLGGSTGAFVALLLAMVGMWAAYLTRGVFAGHNRYAAYGAQLAAEGVLRVVVALGVVALAGAVGGFALGLAAALLGSVALTVTRARRGQRGPVNASVIAESPAARAQLNILGWMVLGGLLMQVLLNVAPVVVQLAPHHHAGAAGHYLGALMLARLPLFVFAAVQAALLPGLAHKVADGDRRGLRRQLIGLFAIIGVGMGAFVALMAAAGPTLATAIFGSGFQLGRADLVLLSVATAAAMLATVAGSAVVAVGAPAAAAAGWGVGVAVLAALLALPAPLFLRLELSYLGGAAGALVALMFIMFRRTRAARSGRAPSMWRIA